MTKKSKDEAHFIFSLQSRLEDLFEDFSIHNNQLLRHAINKHPKGFVDIQIVR